jgi:hypothetical protein
VRGGRGNGDDDGEGERFHELRVRGNEFWVGEVVMSGGFGAASGFWGTLRVYSFPARLNLRPVTRLFSSCGRLR